MGDRTLLHKFLKRKRAPRKIDEELTDSILYTKASEELQDEIEEELKKDDPDKSIARTLLDI